MRVDTDGRWKQCLTYYSRFPSESVVLAGWYCDASGTKPSADRLACLLDRLVLDASLESREADLFMREQSVRTARCSASPVSQTVDTRARGDGSRMSSPRSWSMPSALRFRDR